MENMEIKLNESELIANLVEAKSKAELWDITGVEWVKLYESLSASCYEYLNLVKNKNQKTALVFTDSSDAHNFLLAATIEYHGNDGEEVGGNWSFSYTVNPQDIVDAKIVYSNDPQYMNVLNDCSSKSMVDQDGVPGGFTIVAEVAGEIFDALIRYLLNYLDKNAQEGKVLDLVLDDHFKASVAIEDGVKVIGITPHGVAKTRVKNDDECSEEVSVC